MSAPKKPIEILSLGTSAAATPAEVSVKPGMVVVITGPNGVGKSALLQAIPNASVADSETFFGSRQIHFSSEETYEIGQDLTQFRNQLRGGAVTRWRNPWGEQHLKSVMRRILDRQLQTSQDIVTSARSGTTIEEAVLRHPQPIEQINGVFEAARLPISFSMVDGRIRASRESSSFGIERLSDGERAALLVVGAIVVRPAGSFILIDEPERHLNPSISGALIAAAVRCRPDIGYVFATHDLSLIDWLRPDKVIHIQNSKVIGTSDDRTFEYSVLGKGEEIPEFLRYAVLGSRKAVLMVEGTTTSEDRALYGHVYPEWNVVPREGWDTVISAVSILKQNSEFHWLTVAGVIDGDGREEVELNALALRNIFALPSPTIENIFLTKLIVEEMAKAAHALSGGETVADRLSRIEAEIRPLFLEAREEMISRRVMWTANRKLSERKVSLDDVSSGQSAIEGIDLTEIKSGISAFFDRALQSSSVFELLTLMPVKNSKIPSKIAKCVGFDNFRKYAQAVLNQIETGSPYGVAILRKLKEILPTLPTL